MADRTGGNSSSARPTAKQNGPERSEAPDKKNSNKPGNTAFKQQRLPAWQPILTAGTVLPAFFIIGIIFVPLGAILYITSNGVQERIVEYTDCTYLNTTDGQDYRCRDLYDTQPDAGITCHCVVEFELEKEMVGNVYLLYMLTNYFQNHRRYVNSRDDLQLLGESQTSPVSECKPYQTKDTDPGNKTNLVPVAPCGAIANSMFNDTFTLAFVDGNNNKSVTLNGEGIAWYTDKNTKFNNPASFNGTTSPPNWQRTIQDLPNGYKNEDFIVWMRTAALPTFRKLHRRVINVDNTVFANGLPAGDYSLNIAYSYPVHMFEGTKSIVLTTTSWLGGKNSFLGIAYMATGTLCIVFGAFFLIVHIRHGRRGSTSEANSSSAVG